MRYGKRLLKLRAAYGASVLLVEEDVGIVMKPFTQISSKNKDCGL